MSGPIKVPIKHRSINLSIIYKLLKATATKYGCTITYDEETNEIHFEGPEEMHKPIIEEVVELFNK